MSGLKITSLASYFDTSRKIGFSFNIVEYNGEGLVRFLLGHVDKMKTLHFSSAFLDDDDWHRLCIGTVSLA